MNATIQVIMAAHVPPEISHGNHLTWTHGQTKVILQSTWAAKPGEQPWRKSYLRVSTKVSIQVVLTFLSNEKTRSAWKSKHLAMSARELSQRAEPVMVIQRK